jgi:hypothetical protein
MNVNAMIKRAVEERASQILKEKAQKIGPEEFKRAMNPFIINGILEQAAIDMDECLIASIVAFRKQYKITSCMICGAKGDEPCDAGLHS